MAKARAGRTATTPTPENPEGLRDIPFALPTKSPDEKRRAMAIYKALETRYPDAHCELTYTAPHELLIATILSAQATDVGVNKATPALFETFPTPAAFARSSPEEIEPYVKSLGFFRNKAKAVYESMKAVVEEFGGAVPRTMDELLSLRGVARKTANVVLGNAYGINVGVTVDTHVIRLATLYALAPEGANPIEIEKHLMALLPRDTWCMLSHLLIFHGRRCSTARTKPEDDPIFVEFGGNAGTRTKRVSTKKVAKRAGSKKTSKKKTSKKKTSKKAASAKPARPAKKTPRTPTRKKAGAKAAPKRAARRSPARRAR